jgi:hypothetical protein
VRRCPGLVPDEPITEEPRAGPHANVWFTRDETSIRLNASDLSVPFLTSLALLLEPVAA